MTPERFQQVEALYHAARQRTAEQRAALLAEADPDVRREVESLLAQRTGGEFLDRPAIQNAPQLLEDSTLTELAVGASLGPYRIESKLGGGGMGVVYRAREHQPGMATAAIASVIGRSSLSRLLTIGRSQETWKRRFKHSNCGLRPILAAWTLWIHSI